MLKRTGLTVGSIFIASCSRPPEQKERWVSLGPIETLGNSKKLDFELVGVRVQQDRKGFYAMSLFCTHQRCLLNASSDGGFICPCHGAVFGATGIPTRGPAKEPLSYHPLRMTPNGELEVDLGGSVSSDYRLLPLAPLGTV